VSRYLQCLVVSLFVSVSCGLVLADQITLKNGDHLTGKVLKSDGKTLVLHTEAAGDVTIQFAAIQEIKTDEDLHVVLKDGKTAIGPVTSNDGKLEVQSGVCDWFTDRFAELGDDHLFRLINGEEASEENSQPMTSPFIRA